MVTASQGDLFLAILALDAYNRGYNPARTSQEAPTIQYYADSALNSEFRARWTDQRGVIRHFCLTKAGNYAFG